MAPVRRRAALLTVAAGTIPLAGCLTRFGGTNASLDLGERHETPDGLTVTVHAVRVSKLIRSTSVGSSTHIDVACLDGHQFAVVDAAATGADGESALADVRFALDIDGTRYPRDDQHWYRAHPPGSYDRPGRPAIPAPVADATEAAVVLLRDGDPSARWALPAETVDALGRAPAFAIRSFETPDSVRRGSTFEAGFTVANTGDRDGRFVAEFGAGPISDHDEVAVDVPGGAEQGYAETMDPHYGDESDAVAVALDWGCERRRRSVAVTD